MTLYSQLHARRRRRVSMSSPADISGDLDNLLLVNGADHFLLTTGAGDVLLLSGYGPATIKLSIPLVSSNNPTYHSGYYSPVRGGFARYPGLWKRCIGAWCPGLGPTGIEWIDHSGYRNNGVVTAATLSTFWAVDEDGYAGNFDGTDDHVDLPNIPLAASSDFSISVWFNLDTVPGTFSTIVSIEESLFVRIDVNSSSEVEGYLNDGVANRFIGTTAIDTGTWYNAVFSRNGGTYEFYLDGQSTGSGSHSDPSTSGTGITAIGARNNADSNDYEFDGLIDGVRIYDRALDPNEISLLASRRKVAYQLAAS